MLKSISKSVALSVVGLLFCCLTEAEDSVDKVLRVGFEVKLDTVLEYDGGDWLWYHPRVAAIPGIGKADGPAVVMTLQKHLKVSDYYSGESVMLTADRGKTWSEPDPLAVLDWRRDENGVVIAVADVTPGWHAPTGKMLAFGAEVRYSEKGEQLGDQPRSHQTAYAVYDPKTGEWVGWKRLEMPADPIFEFARNACSQWLVEPDGTLLLAMYVSPETEPSNHLTTVVRFSFDGKEMKYLEHGNLLELKVARGLYEPSLAKFQGKYYLTLRNDVKGYVTTSEDGLQYEAIKLWTFDDGAELGSYNTQQHWLTHSEGLFLTYTRRGANNDHIMRHRAPLFIAQVDPQKLVVLRDTEQVLVPERGATLGNFGASAIDSSESWVTVSEGVFSDEARKRGAKGAVFVSRVVWAKPNRLVDEK